MNKQKQIQEYESKRLIDELSRMPPMVIVTAYLHAINYTLYGEDVTVRWMTATQNAKALEKAHRKGYYDALQRQAENEPMQIIASEDAISRQAAIDSCLNGWNKGYKEIVEEIRDLPPVTPAEKVGHWINPTTMQCMKEQIFYYCSVCGNYADANKYCPNCGAKMQEVN